MRKMWLPVVLCAAFVCVGCSKSEVDAQRVDQSAAARQFSADKLAMARELEETARRRSEIVAANQEDIHSEAEGTFRKYAADHPAMDADEVRVTDVAIARLRARMSDPAAMQARDAYFTPTKTALCLEINTRENGKYVGFRKVYVTPETTEVEPDPNELSHRIFELNFEKVGCNAVPPKAR